MIDSNIYFPPENTTTTVPDYYQIHVENQEQLVGFESDDALLVNRFRQAQNHAFDIFVLKNEQYGPDNIQDAETTNDEALKAVYTRMRDKINRIKNLLDNPDNGEPIEDAYLDLSNYCLISYLVKNGKWRT